MKHIVLITFISLFCACGESQKPNASQQPDEEQLIQNLNDVTVNLPEAPGKDLVIRHCITCHSLRYIEMQPNFSEKAWQKTVDKMRKNFGAPIPEKDAAAIVKYLVRVKGKK